MFRLHVTILLRPLGKWTTLYLLVHPERIQSIVFNLCGDDFISLHFTMTQAPTFVVPKEMQESYELRPQDQGHFDNIKSLARLRQFTVYLDRVDLIPETMEQLALLPSVFSSSHPFGLLHTNGKLASFDVLFRGAPGQVIDLGMTAPPSSTNHNQTLAEIAEETEPTGIIPPPYRNGSSSRNTPGSSTPNDRKRRRTSELLSRSLTTDEHILLAVRRILDRTASLDVRLKLVEELTESLDAENACPHDREEVEQIIDDRIDDKIHDVRRELEGQMLTETEERVEETVDVKCAELRQEIIDEWIEDIRHDISAQLGDRIKKEIFKGAVRALIKVYKGEQDDKSPKKKMSRKFGRVSPSASTASAVTQSTHSSTALATASKLRITASETSPSMPGEVAFQTAIEDIQKLYGGRFSAEEMMRVLDFLGRNLMEAVKYNTCGAELKWLYVQKWAKVNEGG
ncbi:hypothetical protein QBC45DRAFT_11108 [Copromyces sp. CBS 386.78]|nr:hypothetical protein QBC45DRAFT_11108 [Copromyces sp. CBS 386.78]